MRNSYSGVTVSYIVRACVQIAPIIGTGDICEVVSKIEEVYFPPALEPGKFRVSASVEVDVPLRTVFFFVRITSVASNHLEFTMPFAVYSVDNNESYVLCDFLKYHKIAEALANPRGFMRGIVHVQNNDKEINHNNDDNEYFYP